MKKGILIFTVIFLGSLIFHLWVRKNIKPYVKKNYESLYEKNKDPNALGEWDFKFDMYNYPAGENARVIDSLVININDPINLKIERIANYILNYTEGRIGTPDFQILSNKSPYEQLKLIQNGKSHVWCGLFSYYYSYFLDGAGISSRYVSLEKPGDTVIGTHVITEIYNPEEKKWIYSDLTYDIIYVKNAGGNLNLVELVTAIEENDEKLVFIQNDLNNGLIKRTINEIDKNYIEFMKSQSEIRYLTGQQLRNNFIPFTITKKISEIVFPSSSYFLFAKENSITNHLLFTGTRLSMILSFIFLLFFIFYRIGNGFITRK